MEERNLLPNFMCVGVTKAGTTTLHHALLSHPDIFLPKIKETFFFSANKNYRHGLSWYLENYYSGTKAYPFRGEIAPTYFYHSEKVSQRLATVYQKDPLKIVVVFRDPVSRAYSHYWHMRRLGWEKEVTFEKALLKEGQRKKRVSKTNEAKGIDHFAYFESGLYARKLKPFLDVFPMDRFHFLLFDDLKENYNQTMSSLLTFLGAQSLPLLYEHRNKATETKNWQTVFWNRAPRNLKGYLRSHIPANLRSSATKSLGLHRTRLLNYPPMDKRTESQLRERFETEVIGLSKIINRDLSHWLP